MPPKKPGAASPLKKKLKDPSKTLGSDGADSSHARADGGGGSGQDNDEMDAYHEPVRRCACAGTYKSLSTGTWHN